MEERLTMSNEFDLERAQRGEQVQFSSGSMDGKIPQRWVDVHFVGLSRSGVPLVQMADGSTLITGALRMKPQPKWAVVVNDHGLAVKLKSRAKDAGESAEVIEIPAQD